MRTEKRILSNKLSSDSFPKGMPGLLWCRHYMIVDDLLIVTAYIPQKESANRDLQRRKSFTDESFYDNSKEALSLSMSGSYKSFDVVWTYLADLSFSR